MQYLDRKSLKIIRKELPQDLETVRRLAQPGGHQPGAHGGYSETDDPLVFYFLTEQTYGVPDTLRLEYDGRDGKLRRILILDGQKDENPIFYAPINL